MVFDEIKFPKIPSRTATNSWCCLATIESLQHSDENDILLTRETVVAGERQSTVQTVTVVDQGSNCKNDIHIVNNDTTVNRYEVEIISKNGEGESISVLDLSIPVDWMEYIERAENRSNDPEGAGAYDIFRCDYVLQKVVATNQDITVGEENHSCEWRVWGAEFHLERLKNSYLSLVQSGNDNMSEQDITQKIQIAFKESYQLIDSLLEKAENSELFQKWHADFHNTSCKDSSNIVALLKVTLLWSKPNESSSEQDKIIVRGHACCNNKLVQVSSIVKPIICSIAAKYSSSLQNDIDQKTAGKESTIKSVTFDETIPTRFDNPNLKVASWTRLRKQMDTSSAYKPSCAEEVLLVKQRQSDGEIVLLEGSSSNLFVLYMDGTLRTSSDGVLKGYVRHLVILASQKLNISVDTEQPILVSDAERGLWKEAFITSSSRLILPISNIVISNSSTNKNDGAKSFVTIWEDSFLSSKTSMTDSDTKPTWERLLGEILTTNGMY